MPLKVTTDIAFYEFQCVILLGMGEKKKEMHKAERLLS